MAKVIRDRMRCGSCGSDTFRVHNIRTVGASVQMIGKLALTCNGCEEVSFLEASLSMEFAPAPESTGMICGGWYRDSLRGKKEGATCEG